MKATLERVAGSRVVLDVEVPPEEMQADIQDAYRRLARQVRVPGFRPGRAPAQVLERLVGRPRVLQEALDPMVTRAYQAALVEHGILPVEQPAVDVRTYADGEPLHFVATVTVRPEVRLADWSGIAVAPEPAVVEEADIDRALEELRESRGTWVPSEDPAAQGDMVILKTTGRVAGGPRVEEQRVEGVLGGGRVRPEIEAAALGKTAGAVEELDLVFPADDHSRQLAGRTAHVRVEVLEVKRRERPTLDDAFAAEVSERQTLEELRADLGNTLRQVADLRALQAALDRAVEQIVDASEVDLPDILIERAVDNLMSDMDRRAVGVGDSLLSQLSRAGNTLEALRTGLRPGAERRIRTQLVLDAVAAERGLLATEAEVEAEIARIGRENGSDPVAFRRMALQPDNRAAIGDELGRGKALRYLRDATVRPASRGGQEEAVEAPVEEASAGVQAPAGVGDAAAPAASRPDPQLPLAAATTPGTGEYQPPAAMETRREDPPVASSGKGMQE